jgi:ATP adenylyltransferase
MSEEFVNHENTTGRLEGVYGQTIKQIMRDGVCPFCPEHLAKYHQNPTLKEGRYWLLTKNMYPYIGAAHHYLLIHKKHIQGFDELTDAAWSELKEVTSWVLKERKIKGGALLMRFGDTKHTGASVTHLHAQLVSGTGDKDADPVLARVG